MGYAAGHTANPSYQEACSGMTGHTEAVQALRRAASIDPSPTKGQIAELIQFPYDRWESPVI